MVFDKEFLDKLTASAKESPRLRMNYDLRDSAEDGSQRMLNAIEPGSVVPVHKHDGTSETVVLLRGSAREILYDEQRRETSSVVLSADLCPAVQVPKGVFHSIESLESGTVICEFKEGRYEGINYYL